MPNTSYPGFDRDRYRRGRQLFASWRASRIKSSYSAEAESLIDYYVNARQELYEQKKYRAISGAPINDSSKPKRWRPKTLAQDLEDKRLSGPELASAIGGSSVKSQSPDYRNLGTYYGSGENNIAADRALQDENIFRTGKFGDIQKDTYADRRRRKLIGAYQSRAGYFHGDPRLSLQTNFGIIEGFENFVIDTETVERGAGNRVFSITFGRYDPTRKGFSKFNTVYTPIEMLFNEELLEGIRTTNGIVNKYTSAERGRQSLDYLRNQLFAAFEERQRQMGIAESDIVDNLNAFMNQYKTMGKDDIMALDARRGRAARNYIAQLQKAGFDYRQWEGRGLNLIGYNIGRFDRGAMLDILRDTRRMLDTAGSYYSTVERHGPAELINIDEARSWLENQVLHIEGTRVPGGRWNALENRWDVPDSSVPGGWKPYTDPVVPRASYFEVSSLNKNRAWGRIVSARRTNLFKALKLQYPMIAGESKSSFLQRAVGGEARIAKEILKLDELTAKGALSNSEMAWILGLDMPKGLHGSDVDARLTARILEVLPQRIQDVLRTGESVSEFGSYSIAEMIEKEAIHGVRVMTKERRKFAKLANTLIEESGGTAGLAYGRLSGLEVSRFKYSGGTRFTLSLPDMPGDKGFAKLITPYDALANMITKATGADREAIVALHASGALSSRTGVSNLLDAYARNRGMSLASIVEATKGYDSATNVLNKMTTGYVDLHKIPGLSSMSPLQRAVAVAEQTSANFMSKMGGAVAGRIPGYRINTDVEATRILERISGAMDPLNRLKSEYRSIIEASLGGINSSNRDTVGKIATVLTERVWQNTTAALVSSGKQSVTSGIGSVFGNAHALSGILRSELYNRDLATMLLDPKEKSISFSRFMLDVVGDDIKLSESEKTAVHRTFQRFLWGGEGLIPGRGIERYLPIRDPEVLGALGRVLGNENIMFSDSLANKSAGQALFSVASSYNDMLSRRMAAEIADATVSQRGLWHVASAIADASPEVLEEIRRTVPKSTLGAIDELRNWAGGTLTKAERGQRVGKIGKYQSWTGPQLAKFIGAIELATSQSFSTSKFMQDIDINANLSLQTLHDVEISMAGTNFTVIDDIDNALTRDRISTQMRILRDEMISEETSTMFNKAVRSQLGKKADPRVFRTFLESPGAIGFMSMIAEQNEELIALAQNVEDGKPQRAINIGHAIRTVFANPNLNLSIGSWDESGSRFALHSRATVASELKAASDAFAVHFGFDGPVVPRRRASAFDNVLFDIASSIRSSSPSGGVELWSGVPGRYWDMPGKIDVHATRMPSASFVSKSGLSLENTAVVTPVGGGKPLAIGWTGKRWVRATGLAVSEQEFGYKAKARTSDLLLQLSDTAAQTAMNAGQLGTNRAVPMSDAQYLVQSLQEAEFRDMEAASIAASQERAARRSSSMARASLKAAADIADAADTSRHTTETLSNVMKRIPSNWKVLAAGAAGLAAITMLRKERPLTPEDNASYGGGAAQMAYPMGYMPVAPQTTYMGAPPTQGMRASISGVVGPDVDISSLQNLVGGMGFANINLNDNSSSLTQRDIDRMMSSRL